MAARKARRANAAQVPRRRRLVAVTTAVIVLLSLAAAAFGYDHLTEPGRLPLRVIEVNGEFRRLQRERIRQTVIDAIDGGFFDCDMPKLRAAVLAMPWVADVSIRRIWPDKLSMRVTEEVPLARWGETALINGDGGVFVPASLDGFDGLAKLSGPTGSQQRLVAFYKAVVPAAHARELRIDAIELDERRHWWVMFGGGLTLSLGRENVNHRLAQFFRVYPSLNAQPARRPARVDMRYAHGFAVRWRELADDDAAAEDMKLQGKA